MPSRGFTIAQKLSASSAEYRVGTTTKNIPVGEAWNAASPVTLTDNPTINIDFSLGFNFTVTLQGNRTIPNPINMKPGQSGYILIYQDGTGSRTLTLGSYFKWTLGSVIPLSVTPSVHDILYYTIVSTTEIHVSLSRTVS